MRTLVWLIVLSGTAWAAPPSETACQAGDNEACLDVADKAFEAKQNDLAIVTALALCEKGEGEGCMRAAHYMDRLKISVRAGKTPAQLRARGMKQLETSCAANSGSACFRFGKALHQGKGIAADPKRGQELLDKGCTLKFAAACVFLASLDRNGAKGRAYLERACDAGDGPGCTSLGDRDKKRAPALYAKACTAEDAAGCAKLGGIQRSARQLDKAVASFEAACELGLDKACVDAGALRDSGKGVVDPVKAREHYTQACDAKVGPGCLGLALLVATNRGGARNWGQAVELARSACAMEAKGACAAAKKLAARPPDGTCATMEACTALCDEKIPKACIKVGELLASSGTRDACDEAEALYVQLCDGDIGGGACARAGNAASSREAAAPHYEKACQQGDSAACLRRAFILALDNDADAYAVLEAACKKRQLDSCYWLARVMPESRLAEAERHLRAACGPAHPYACELLAFSLEEGFVPGKFPTWGGGATCCDQAIDVRSPAERKRAAARLKESAVWKEKACKLGRTRACGSLEGPPTTCRAGDLVWDY